MSDSTDFRRIALGLLGAVEGAHMGHPDFRVGGKIFATLHADDVHGMVKLTPDQQQRLVEEHPAAFTFESGAWGRQGCTRVRLEAVDEETLGAALTMAWRDHARSPRSGRPRRPTAGNTAPKRSNTASSRRRS
jgi:hypothetical protein